MAAPRIHRWSEPPELASPPTERLWDPAVIRARAAIARLAASVERAVRRLVKRPKSVTIQVQGIQATASVSGKLTVRKGYGPLPTDPAAALGQLDERTREILGRLYDHRDAADEAVNSVREELAGLSRRFDSAIDALGAETRRVAIGGIACSSLV